jgi:trigger factor
LREAPKMTVETLSKESFALTLTFPVYPEVTLCDYKHIPLAAKRSNEVTEQEVDDDVNKLLKKAGSLKAKDENAASANGDTVNIDFVGYLDGEKFPGGEAKSYDLVLGSNSFIPGFEEQLVGKKAGEKVEVKLSFPKDYHASNLAGKETLFKVTVNEVFEMVPGTLDKEFFKKVNTPGITNEQELRDYLKKSLAD